MKTLAIPIIFLVLLIPVQAFAQNYADEVTKYHKNMFGIVSGKYNDKNGITVLSGIYKLTDSKISDVRVSGTLKYWDYWDSAIPNCRYAFSDDMVIMFDKNKSHGKLVLSGKLCEANWSGDWKTLRADYIIMNGKAPYTSGMDGKGVLDITLNVKTGQVLSGKLSGYINLYT